MVPTETTISAVVAATLFKMKRTTFYNFAHREGIRDVSERIPGMTRPDKRVYSLEDVIRVYRKYYNADPDVSAAERAAQSPQ